MSYDARTHELADRVVETDRFLARAEAGEGEGTYHLRESGLAVLVRHGTPDVALFAAVFADRIYDPPGEARLAILRGAGPRRILDLHAHVGFAATYLLGLWPGAQVTAVEADPADVPLLARCAAANAGAGDWEVLDAPIAADEVLARCDRADVVKLETAGGGWALLSDPRFAAADLGAIAVSYSPEDAPSDDPAAEVDGLLRAAGLTPRFAFEQDGAGLFWAWR